ncbi:MAG: DUF2281 domain-containing protein [Pseudanabaena sp.]|jgi:hypothetical protein
MVQSIDKKNEPRNPDSLDAELLQAIAIMPQDIKIAVLDYAEYLINKHTQSITKSIPQTSLKKRQAGLLKGKIWMSDDFDAPLDEMKDYM